MTDSCFFVFARGGSKRIPNKNLQLLDKLTLLEWSVRSALAHTTASRIFISTDSETISLVAQSLGVNVIHRPPELASDNSPEILSWKHAVKHVRTHYFDFQSFISLPTTSPFRFKETIDSAISKCSEYDIVMSGFPSRRNPWFNQVIQSDSGSIRRIIPLDTSFNTQTSPTSFDLTTVVYAANPRWILSTPDLWTGSVGLQVVSELESLDIDTPLDLEFARFLLASKTWQPT